MKPKSRLSSDVGYCCRPSALYVLSHHKVKKREKLHKCIVKDILIDNNCIVKDILIETNISQCIALHLSLFRLRLQYHMNKILLQFVFVYLLQKLFNLNKQFLLKCFYQSSFSFVCSLSIHSQINTTYCKL